MRPAKEGSYWLPPKGASTKILFVAGSEKRQVPSSRMSGLHVLHRHYPLDYAHAGDSNCHTFNCCESEVERIVSMEYVKTTHPRARDLALLGTSYK